MNEIFSDKFGLLEAEVEELLSYYGLSAELPKIREWYDGYRVGSCNGIYNPWSVLQCISNGTFAPYWINTSDNTIIKRLLVRGGGNLKADVEVLLKDGIIEKKIEEGIIFPELDKNPTIAWSLFVYTGYLTIDNTPSYGTPCRLKIPNIEVKELFQSIVVEWFDKSIDPDNYRLLLESLIAGEMDTFSRIFQQFMLSSFSVFDIPLDESEKIYHAFVLGILVGLKDRYDVKSNRESGYGRYDVVLFPKNSRDLGIIMEFKKVAENEEKNLEKVAKSAIKQIEEKKYSQELLDRGIARILQIGFAFSGKQVAIVHKFRG